jgi:capsular exopolysaccharide synthesis family protein
LAFFVDRLDRRLRTPSDAERAFDLPVIGLMPRGAGPSVAEASRSLWAGLRHANGGREPRSILITSPGPEDGRTTTAWHLAAAAAETGTRVLLIEADLRHPRLAQFLELEGEGSLAGALTSQRDLSGDVQRVELDGEVHGRSNGGGPVRAVDVLSAGPPPSDPSYLLASERMRQLLAVAKERYALVIIDTAPLLTVADAVPLLPEAGGALVVLRIGHTRRMDAHLLADRLRNLRVRLVGVVLTNADKVEGRYSSYAEPPARRPIPA